MKKKTDVVESLRADIKREIAHWIALNKYGVGIHFGRMG